MIKKITLSILAIILLGSCANKFSLVKRKYNKGYHFAMSKGHSNSKESQAGSVETAVALNSKKSVMPSEKNEKELMSVAPIKTTQFAQNSKKTSEPKQKGVTASAEKKPVSENKSFRSITKEQMSSLKNGLSKAGKGDAGGNLILMVILCLFPFICLIPVYLHDGKKVTLNFWITLLLHLTFIGYIIFALLVVLDVVNLA
ncbi:MAG: hypothetical protein H0W61_14075 [Bacteroidetes bacterium]|nr:hypothetical protein [Bacteroidota bacterium]